MTKPIYILGLSCFYHDSAAVLLKDGEIIFAAQEERFTRKKHDASLPINAVQQALQYANISISDVSAVGFYDKPFLKFFDRILQTSIKMWPRGFSQFHMAMQEWMTKKLWTPQLIEKDLSYKGDVYYTTHHEAHAASAYYCSGFSEAVTLTIDGVGEWATTAIGYGQGKDLQLKQEIHYPHSLGLLYSAFTYYLGFKVNSAEYKVMGLAPYGEPKYVDYVWQLIDLKADGSFRLNMTYFTFEHGLTMTGRKFASLFGQPRRKPDDELTQFHKDVARSLQEVLNVIVIALAKHAKEICPSDNLCLAGGVALNCVANGALLRENLFKDIFIQPAAGDAGGALGTALAVWHRIYDGERLPRLDHVYLGTEYTNDEIETLLKDKALPYQQLDDDHLCDHVTALLEGENVIGWYQGRMEYGPRALGNRSILADARNAENWQKVNLKIKYREDFRPFAPTVLTERTDEYFELDRESPYMLLVADVRPEKRGEIPAVTHVDGSARVQTIRREQNPRYHGLLKAFEQRTGCGVIINTSFNVRGEPVVESPQQALECFLHTGMDYLVLGNCVVNKKEMPNVSEGDADLYLKQFGAD